MVAPPSVTAAGDSLAEDADELLAGELAGAAAAGAGVLGELELESLDDELELLESLEVDAVLLELDEELDPEPPRLSFL